MGRPSCFIVVVFFFAHSILFTGRCDGEFMYDIEVEALDPLPVTVPLMQSELGRYMSTNLLKCCVCYDIGPVFASTEPHMLMDEVVCKLICAAMVILFSSCLYFVLSRQCQRTLLLSNPLLSDVTLCCQGSNTDHFSVAGLNEGKVGALASHSDIVFVVVL